MTRVISALVLLAVAWTAGAEPTVKINVNWQYKEFVGPVSIYETRGQPPLWETKSVADLSAAPVSKPMVDSSFRLALGQRKRFALVVQNTTDKPIFFFAAPHKVYPEEDALGFKFKCLCINHAFTVGPGETWYRIVEFRLSKEFVGDELSITHTIIGISSERAASFSHDSFMHDM